MELQEIIERNYQAAVKRGKITNKTDCSQFATAIRNEVTELEMTLSVSKINPFDVSELTIQLNPKYLIQQSHIKRQL